MMLLLSAKSCQARYGLTVLLLSLVLAACAGNGGGGSVTSSPSGVDRSGIDVVESFAFVRPDTNSVLLNWTNPVLEDDEGIYKFTISYKAVDRPDSAKDLKSLANRSRILDWDNDGVVASMDNCLHVANSGQPDRDKDGVGDACDSIDSSLSFIPSEDAVVIRWLNPLRPADAVVSSTRGPLEGYADSSRRLVGANLTLELLDNGTSIRFEWINPPASVSGLTGEVTITQFSIPGFLDYTANRMNNEHEANTNVSVEQEIAADQRAGLLPGVELPLELQATYDNGTQRATVPIKTDCVLISTNNMIAPCGAEPRYGLPVVDATASGPVIKYFRLMVEDPAGMMDEVRLAADADINVSYSQANAIPVMVEYTYNRTGLVTDPRGYSFSLGIGYDNESGEQFLDAAALLARSPVEAGYNGSVVLGLNTDGDALIDTLDNDSDADGIPNGMDSMELRSALGSVPLGVALGSVTDAPVEFIYEGDEALLGLFGSNRSSFYELEGLAEDSYYTFMVRAHIREYRNEGLAAVLGYGYNPATGRMEAIPDAYAINQTEGSVKAVARTKDEDPTFIGLNTDGDGLANVLDADDDNDGLLDTEEVDAAGVPLMVGGVLCSLLADCDNDTIEDGDARERLVNGDNVSCSLLLDCDGDMVEDSVDAFIVDPFESKDRDGDRVGDNSDNCIFIANAGQVDGDRDGRGDACEGTDAGGVEGAAGGRYHYRGSVAKPDLTVIPGEDHVLISWVHLYPAAVNASFTAAGVAIERAVIGWEVYNLEQNGSDSSWTVGLLDDGAEIEVYTDEAYAVGEVYSIVLDATNITAWHNTVDPGYGYRFNVTFTYDDHDATESTVYAYPVLADASNLVRLLLNTDGDEYADVVDPNDENDGLLDSDEVDRDGAPLLNASGFPCSRLVDCDGDGVDDVSDAFPVDPAEWMDRDRDGIGDNADTFVGFVSDKDRDGRLDAADSCLLVANAVVAGAEVNIDNDNINDACDVNTTAVQDVWFIPQDGALVASWFNPAGVFGFNVSIFSGGSRVVQSGALDSSALLAGFLSAGNYSHYRVEGLTNGEDYNVVVVLLGSDGSMVGSPLGSERDFLYRVRVGENADSDALADSLDLDADNDGLPNTDANEQLMNSDGISCSRLVDCDGDGVSDVSDAFPSDSAETLDSDSDGIGDNADVFPGNPAEVTDSDFDGFGDNIDNCDFRVNFDQANHDGDSEGDVCDADDTNPPDSRVVDFPGSNTYEVTEDEGTANETVVLFSEVVVTWTNPVDLYLPKAVFQPHSSLDVLSFALDILQGGEAVAQAGLNITFVAGADRGDVAVLNRTAGIETGYRIRGLDNGTRYTFVVSAEYSYEALEVDSSDQDATENRTETIVLATVEVETPAVAGVPAVDFTAASGEDAISISWTRPRVPSGYELTGIDVLGCRLDNTDDQCDASTADKLYSVFDTVIMTDNADQPPIILLPPSASVERAYLYNITLNATYEKDGGTMEGVLSEAETAAIYPAAADVRGPVVIVTSGKDSVDSADGFSIRWDDVDTSDTNTDYERFVRIGERLVSYNLTISADSFGTTAAYHHTEIYTVEAWANFDESFNSTEVIGSSGHIASRFYNISISAIYSNGQRSPVATARAAIWPTPEPVSNVQVRVDNASAGLIAMWSSPNVDDTFGNIGEGIRRFNVQACKVDSSTECSSEISTTDNDANVTERTILIRDGLVFENAYKINVTVEYTTGQKSISVSSDTEGTLSIGSRLDLARFEASSDKDDRIELIWTTPADPADENSALTGVFGIKQFNIIPCRYDNHADTSCVNQTVITLEPGDSGGRSSDLISGDFNTKSTYNFPEGVLEQARVYDFFITAVYTENTEEHESAIRKDGGLQLPSIKPGVASFNSTNGFGNFQLSWHPPTDISNFTRIGGRIGGYRITIETLGTVDVNSNGRSRMVSDLTPSITAPVLGEIYKAKIAVKYQTGNILQLSAEQEVDVSIGPTLVAPVVTVTTTEDNVNVSWQHNGLAAADDSASAADFVALGYALNYYVGVDCKGRSPGIDGCSRRHNQAFIAPPVDDITFGTTLGTNQRAGGDSSNGALERGHWYDVLVTANYTAQDGAIKQGHGHRDQGGIYPDPTDVGIHDIEVDLQSGVSYVYWSSRVSGATSTFRDLTGYRRDVTVRGMSAEAGSTALWPTSTKPLPLFAVTGGIGKAEVRIDYTSERNMIPTGHLFDIVLDTTYSGGNNGNYVYTETITSSTHEIGLFPHEGDTMTDHNVTDPRAESGDVIKVSWGSPDFSQWGPEFIARSGYAVRIYRIIACEDSRVANINDGSTGGDDPECISSEVAVPSTPGRITGDLTTALGLKPGVLYKVGVQAFYEGKKFLDVDSPVRNLDDTWYKFIAAEGMRGPGRFYINPTLVEADHNVSNVMAGQVGSTNSLSVNFTQPSNVTAFRNLGFSSLTYNLSLYDSSNNLVMDTIQISRPFNTLGDMVTEIITLTDIPVAEGYYIKVRTIYPTGQFVEKDSNRFSITGVDVDQDNDGLIEIANAAGLLLLGQDLSGADLDGDLEGCPATGCIGYELTNDIILTDAWLPIGDDMNATDGLCWGDGAFTGILDGNGHSIQDLRIDQAANDCIGFFAQLKDAEVRNLSIEATEIIGLKNVGVLAGWAQNATIEDVHVRSRSLKGAQAVGGLVGRIHLDDGSSVVSMYAAATDKPQLVAPAATPSIKDSSARSEQITACASAGGLVGESDRIMIEGSYAISRSISLPFDQASEPVDIDCVGVRSLYRHQVTHHVYKSIGGLVGDGDSSLWLGSGSQWDGSYGADGRIIINIGDYRVGINTRYPSDGVSTVTYGALNLESIVEGGTRIVSSYALSGDLTGNWKIGGLMGDGSASILQDSYAVTNNIHARLRTAGGLIGQADGSDILRSYAISGTIDANGSTTGSADSDKANGEAGGLIGRAYGDIDLQSTYAITQSIIGGEQDRGAGLGSAGGLLGSRFNKNRVDNNSNLNYIINNSYTVFNQIRGFQHRPEVGRDTLHNVVFDNSYWDTNATLHSLSFFEGDSDCVLCERKLGEARFINILYNPDTFPFARMDLGIPPNPVARPSISLLTGLRVLYFRNNNPGISSEVAYIPEFEEGSDIFSEWKKVNCSDSNLAWDFGTNSSYPAIACTPDMPADQRAWYSLDGDGKLQVNTSRIDTTITNRLQSSE